MAICTHWERKDIGEDGREEEGNTDKGKEGLEPLGGTKPFHKQSKLRTQRIISLSRAGWLLSSAAKYFIYHATVKLVNINFIFHNHSNLTNERN